MNNKILSVRLHGEPVGILEQTQTGDMQFTYLDHARMPLSIALPIRKEAYSRLACEAYFGGLLPESDTARTFLAKKYGISRNNTFSLLKAIGNDCAGAVSFCDINQPVVPDSQHTLDVKTISDTELYEHIKTLPTRPLFMGIDELRLSLAGVQDKAAVCVIDGKISIPANGCPSTHIIKPAIPGFPDIIENEYFCLQLAKRLGINACDVEIKHIKDISFLLVKRYDRQIENNYIKRIHQEDFCQATGTLTTKKYQNEGGPGFKACFNILENTTNPVSDRNHLAASLVFNFLIGNMDAHSKNFSLLHYVDGKIALAPLYDILSTLIYPELTKKMAMKIGNKYKVNEVSKLDWENLCKEIGYSYPAMMRMLEKQKEFILENIENQSSNLMAKLRAIVEARLY